MGASQMFTLLVMLLAIGAFVLMTVSVIRTRKRNRNLPCCSYVGVDGVARCTLTGDCGDPIGEEMLLFSQADTLITDEVNRYHDGAYTATTYTYDWRNAEGESLISDSGAYNTDSSRFTLQHPYLFLQSAEEQWSDHRFERMKEEFVKDDCVQFVIDAKRRIRVGMGYVEFLWPDGEYKVPVEDFEDMSISQGVFRFKHRDAAWMGRKGKFNFQYGKLPNAKLFITALDQLAGISWSNEN